MKKIVSKYKIVFLSTFPPTQCGIATFTHDTVTAITNIFGQTVTCVICNITEKTKITEKILFTLNPKIREDYSRVAREINEDDSIKLVHIQHEFGLFGGSYGSFLLDFLDIIKKPVAFTFHSVTTNPNNELRSVVRMLISYANTVFVMTNKSQKILIEDYKIGKEIITYVPHGTHIVSYENPTKAKHKFNLENHIVLSTFGLLGSGKSIETALKALPEIIKHTPNALYLVIGKTHPNNIKNNVDNYRNYLELLVEELRIKNYVHFINRYIEINELLDYLKATDVYLFTSKDPNQAVSGTFAYAMSCACPIVATEIPHTKEVLTSDAGILVDIENSDQLAKATIQLLSDNHLRETMAIKAFQKTRESSWENVAIKHINTYKNLTDPPLKIQYNYPPIKLDHIKKMTTKLGIIQFSKISDPDITSGYTLDDNARALIAMCFHYKLFKDKQDLYYINTYINFIERCQKPTGTFINYVDKNNQEHIKNNYINLEDSNARAVWALGTVVSLKKYLPETIVNKANLCLTKCLKWVKNILSPRAIGFTIKGLFLSYNVTQSNYIKSIIEDLSKNLITSYKLNATDDWKWFENYMTYANSVLPEAMLYTYLLTGKPDYKNVAIESFDFLLSKMFVNGYFKVISNKGWLQKGKEPHQFGEQPIDVSCSIQTLDVFYRTLQEPKYKTMMTEAFSWFLGKNYLNQIMYNPTNGGCYDGMEKEQINLNQGAESTICYLISQLVMKSNQMDEPTSFVKKKSKINNKLHY